MMFNNSLCKYLSCDSKLKEYVKDAYIHIIEMSGWGFIDKNSSVNDKKDVLYNVFPKAFVDRNIQKAEQIVTDLYEFAEVDSIKEKLPPLYIYAMYQMIVYYEELRFEMDDEDPNDYEIKRSEYIHSNYDNETADEISFWFDDISEDFVDFYDDEYIWLDMWEYFFSSIINDPKQLVAYSVDEEEMLELMPNDIRYFWNKLKIERETVIDSSSVQIMQKVLNFKKATESIYYVAFRGPEQPKEEIGRTLLQAYLNVRSYREVKMAAGQSDIFCPDNNTIIETKIWRGKKYFDDGLVELEAYLISQEYRLGYYIIFYNTAQKPFVVRDKSDVFTLTTPNGINICCVFININPISPSKKNRGNNK